EAPRLLGAPARDLLDPVLWHLEPGHERDQRLAVLLDLLGESGQEVAQVPLGVGTRRAPSELAPSRRAGEVVVEIDGQELVVHGVELYSTEPQARTSCPESIRRYHGCARRSPGNRITALRAPGTAANGLPNPAANRRARSRSGPPGDDVNVRPVGGTRSSIHAPMVSGRSTAHPPCTVGCPP